MIVHEWIVNWYLKHMYILGSESQRRTLNENTEGGHRSRLTARNGPYTSLPAGNRPYTRLTSAETQHGAMLAMVRKLDSDMSEIRTKLDS